MSNYENYAEFCGKKVQDYAEGVSIDSNMALRIRVDWEGHEAGKKGSDLLKMAVEDSNARNVTSLLLGDWGGAAEGHDSSDVVNALVGAKDKLPCLKELFVGDIQMEESEISWIEQSNLSALWKAFPILEHVQIRGGNCLSLGSVVLPELQSLIIETGGLDSKVLKEIFSADLPKLRHLEVWLGDEGYGANSNVSVLQPVLSGNLFPSLTYLGMRNCEYVDEIAKELLNSPIVERINILDLSMGILTDEGATALINTPQLKNLELLDLHHHFLSNSMMEKLRNTFSNVDLSDQEDSEEYDGEIYRYVAVSE